MMVICYPHPLLVLGTGTQTDDSFQHLLYFFRSSITMCPRASPLTPPHSLSSRDYSLIRCRRSEISQHPLQKEELRRKPSI
ncbi:hypothetical protein Ccrd_018950 [Cynara cardunculus var. scolymus]|uniref:Uncharacterized protein n=1 Tax=Cynara cardunculus var. scolymus TaxID=59895 RepID=A0A124SFB6_CYNCS|nr:hypothetical protein Ccrd_018950 [Cynara cardunculus var. scolymus]